MLMFRFIECHKKERNGQLRVQLIQNLFEFFVNICSLRNDECSALCCGVSVSTHTISDAFNFWMSWVCGHMKTSFLFPAVVRFMKDTVIISSSFFVTTPKIHIFKKIVLVL
jgi:hypothetical protein